MTDQPELERRLLATGYDRDNFPRMNSERWLPVGLAKEAAAEIARLRGQRDQLVNLLERASTILGNMALENEGAIFSRWPISHEPLRADARGLLPEILAALAAVEDRHD